jgi:peroxiredoxin
MSQTSRIQAAPGRPTLRERIDAYLDSIDLPETARHSFIDILRGLRLQDHAPGLEPWSRAPDANLTDLDGQPVRLFSLLRQGHLVLTMIRSPANPLCRLQMQAYAEIDPQLAKFGTRQIVIAVQDRAALAAMVKELQLPFAVYSDPDHEVGRAYGLITAPSSALRALRSGLASLDLANQQEIQPSPGTYLIDRTGVVREAHVIADFSERWEPEAMLEAARRLALH